MRPQTNAECIACSEAITNPICTGCLEKEISYWLLDKKPELVENMLVNVKEPENYGETQTKCIVCGSRMNICAHCYCTDIKDIISEHSLELVDDFVIHFDFELGRR